MFALIRKIKNNVNWVELHPSSNVFCEIRRDLTDLESELTDLFKEEEARVTLKALTASILQDYELIEDMLEALEQIIDRVGSIPGCDCGWCERNTAVIEKARKVIARAKGE